jgi:hypothetical protein
MKRVWLLVGVVVGIVIGSSMGRKPYETLKSSAHSLGSRPETRKVKNSLLDAASSIGDTAADTITHASEKVQDRLSTATS